MYDLTKIKEQIKKHKIISFDIFDTLILRPFMKPTDLFLFMEKRLNKPGFAKARVKAEKRARRANRFMEVSLDQIYKNIADEYIDLEKNEMKFEYELSAINPLGYKIYKYAVDLGKTIFITSDMYLSEKFLIKLLNKHGINKYHKLFISSSYGVTKLSGKLFKKVIKESGTIPSNILHIGDFYYGDIFNAKKSKLHAMLLPSPKKIMFGENKRYRVLYHWNKNSLLLSIYLALVSQFLMSENQSDYWFRFGFMNGGPVIFSFVNWLKGELDKEKVKDVAFIARDGYTLKKAFDLISNGSFNSRYIYAPRKMNVLLNLSYNSVGLIKNKKKRMTALASIFEYYNKLDAELKAAPSCSSYNSSFNFFNEHKNIYKRLVNQKRKEYYNYLSSYFKTKKIALVDTTTSNFSGQQLLSSILSERSIRGYYYQIFSSSKKKKCFDSICFHKHISHFIYRWELMEMIMSSPEPPIVDVRYGKPVYKSITKEEKFLSSIYPQLSNGCIAFVKKVKETFGNIDFYASGDKVTEWVNHFIAYPSKEDVNHFMQVCSAKDFAHQKYFSMFGNWNIRKYFYRLLNLILFSKIRNFFCN